MHIRVDGVDIFNLWFGPTPLRLDSFRQLFGERLCDPLEQLVVVI